MRRGPIWLGLLLACVAPSVATADPQVNVGVTVGAVGRGRDHQFFEEPAFHAGVRGDVMLARSSTNEVGVGPYVEGMTNAFDDLSFGGGGSLLLPVIDAFPIVLSVGGYGHYDAVFQLEPGVAATFFWGPRSVNFSANYDMAFGFVGEARIGLGDSRETAFVFAAQLDAAFIFSPVVYLIDAIRGGSREVDRVPGK